MPAEIRIYVEGGGDSKDGRAEVRKGFNGFLNQLVEAARVKRIRWAIVACGSRNSAFDDFKTALRGHPDAFNILLVDSEGPVSSGARDHLKDRDKWDLSEVKEEQCHLMVQLTESWLIADVECLKQFYGQKFLENRIPKNPNVEVVAKAEVMNSLEGSTKETQKGTYHKLRHCPQILKRLRPPRVRAASFHCNRLFDDIQTFIDKQ